MIQSQDMFESKWTHLKYERSDLSDLIILRQIWEQEFLWIKLDLSELRVYKFIWHQKNMFLIQMDLI